MTGLHLAQYRIDAELGRGGMGIVYRATDTKLERTVALKVLPAAALASDDDRARFYREARAAAALNHPNIAAIHQIDEAVAVDADGKEVAASDGPRPFIAMEFIEGGTLEQRIRERPLRLREAVRIATQVADALKAAHAKGIVHRDIKSANIMLTTEGEAKVLDFGLALTAASTKLTRMGSTLGTVAYMSPEQARGEEVDSRTDLYSLGTVLYEMVAGRLPFAGDYEQAVLYGILNETPEPLTALRTGVPMELERITNKLLAKVAARRYQTAADLIADLGSLEVSDGTTVIRTEPLIAPAEAATPSRPAWQIAVAGALLVAVGALGAWLSRPSAPEPPVERLVLEMDGMRRITTIGISPDSRYIALTGYDWDGREGLFLFNVEQGTIAHVERSEGADYPWFSPSGTRLSHSSSSDDNAMYVMDIPSGTPRKIVENAWTSYWMDEDRLLYTVRERDVATGAARYTTQRHGANYIHSLSRDTSLVVRGTERASEGSVWFFPGPRIPGTDIAVGNQQGAASYGLDPRLYILEVDDGVMKETDYAGINVQPLSEDILIYQLGDDAGKIVARRFDADTRTFTSPPVDLLESAYFALFQAEPRSGSLVFVPDHLPNRPRTTVLDLESHRLTTFDMAGDDGEVIHIALSSDGSTLIGSTTNGETGLGRIVTVDLGTGQMVIRAEDVTEIGLDLDSGNRTLSLDYDLNNGRVSGARRLISRSSGSRTPVDTLSIPFDALFYGGTVDGGYVVTAAGEVGLLEEDGITFRPWAPAIGSPDVSPDGRHVAFLTPEGLMAVYDRTEGSATELTGLRGQNPRWSADGRSLYYFSLAGLPEGVSEEAEVVRLPVRTDTGFQIAGEPEFVLYVSSPVQLDVGPAHVVVYSVDEVSLLRPVRRSARVVWWRNIGQELDKTLPR